MRSTDLDFADMLNEITPSKWIATSTGQHRTHQSWHLHMEPETSPSVVLLLHWSIWRILVRPWNVVHVQAIPGLDLAVGLHPCPILTKVPSSNIKAEATIKSVKKLHPSSMDWTLAKWQWTHHFNTVVQEDYQKGRDSFQPEIYLETNPHRWVSPLNSKSTLMT